MVDVPERDHDEVGAHCGALGRVKVAAEDAMGFADGLSLF
jgi:hypothetical protein